MARVARTRARTKPGSKRGASRIPNAETLAAIRRVRAREGLVKYDSLDDFRKDMERL